MAREPGTRVVTFSLAETEALGLTGADDFKAALMGLLNDAPRLEADVADFAKDMANGMGCTVSQVVSQALRTHMVAVLSPPKAA